MKLEDLKSEQRVLGVEPAGAVKLLYVKLGTDSAEIAYQLADGSPRMQTLFREHEAKLCLDEGTSPFRFDGNPEELKLAIEAQRIKLAHLFDPMMAVHSSDVEPLPHQIAAVYQDMLPRQPLRFLLADDPGAGKTIMAGLLIRELLLRGDLERCLVVAPGSLVEQWETEMSEKFGLPFALLSRELAERSQTGNPFRENDLLIARLDQLSRNDEWKDRLQADGAGWDLVVVDEAHKMSAHFFGREIKHTKRYQLGQLLQGVTRHLLLMTATPHNGKEEDFRLFMSLVDPERFVGKLKSQEKVEAGDLMRRMIKEELRRFDGIRLFPKRVAQTRAYDLSPDEQDLYEAVTEYVKMEMGRADKLDGKRRGAVGFALTILQRRLASSPLAIYRSLARRHRRLEAELETLTQPMQRSRAETILGLFGDNGGGHGIDDDLDELDDETRARFEDDAAGSLTTARKPDELRAEIATLEKLEQRAKALVASKKDKKRDELSELLLDDSVMRKPDGSYRKLIVFTEHKDTLNYLVAFIREILADEEAVVEIHGGTRRQERLDTQDAFRQNDRVRVLVATDAACEGVNLQTASLLVNYDLPWNPNRIEQRFGRIHRIGQTEKCCMWNLVAMNTREGHVYHALFHKLEIEADALEGRVFDVLGEAFDERSLRDLLIDAIRGGDDQGVQEQVIKTVERALDHDHLKLLMNRQALSAEVMSPEEIHRVRDAMERAEARKLAPHYLYAFFQAAFERFGGRLREREKGRFQVPHVPAKVRKSQAVHGNRRRVLERYHRVTFKRDLRRIHGKPSADLLHPGHPLMASVIRETLSELHPVLGRGAVLVDPMDEGKVPRVLCLLEHTVKDAERPASQVIQTVEIDPDGKPATAGYASHLDYASPPQDPRVSALIDDIRGAEWISSGIENIALSFASSELAPTHLREVRERRDHHVGKAKEAVHARLTREIHRLSKKAKQAQQTVREGKPSSGQETKLRREVDELKDRLARRIKELDAQLHLASQPPRLLAAALVLPVGLVRQIQGQEPPADVYSADPAARSRVERVAVDAVMAAEKALGNTPEDVGDQKIGWDVSSYTASRALRCIEVKGRQAQATTITVTANEVRVALNKGDKYILALVLVDGDKVNGPYYAQGVFHQELQLNQPSVQVTIKSVLERAKAPGAVFTSEEMRAKEEAAE
ncbi:MAG: helicase-related protein [Myxococcota bacterium]